VFLLLTRDLTASIRYHFNQINGLFPRHAVDMFGTAAPLTELLRLSELVGVVFSFLAEVLIFDLVWVGLTMSRIRLIEGEIEVEAMIDPQDDGFWTLTE